MSNSNLRNKFHNQIKRQLSVYTREGDILDIGFGRGGDLLKYHHQNIKSLIGIDKDEKSLQEAIKRVQERNDPTFGQKIKVFAADMTQKESFDKLFAHSLPSSSNTIDCVCAQFSLHYMAETEQTMGRLLRWVHYILRNDGYFIGTLIDGDLILHQMKDSSKHFKNSIAEIQINSERQDWGTRVKYTLTDSVVSDGSQEFLVFWNTFNALCQKTGFRLIQTLTFDEWYKILSISGLSEEEKQISFCNRSFVYQKKS